MDAKRKGKNTHKELKAFWKTKKKKNTEKTQAVRETKLIYY